LITIVNEGQDSAIVKILTDNNASVAFSSHGKGTASSDLYEVFGLSNNKTRRLFGDQRFVLARDPKGESKERFAISNYRQRRGDSRRYRFGLWRVSL
jgi:hypothetical protein